MARQEVISLFVLQCIMTFTLCLPFTENMKQAPTCGYESCNKAKPGMINVHLVPHTHDDVGWIMTIDQYYYDKVQWIISSVVEGLKRNPERRFIYVEQAFFKMWYDEQNEDVKNDVKQLVNEGRLEFILGGWSMTDEAGTHYTAIIDDHKLGFEFLRQEFGECARPRIGWQIDPFGHAREEASIFAQFGFDSLFFARLDYQDKKHRQDKKTMEMIWEASPTNLGSQANLMTSVLYNMYNPPNGFQWDINYRQNDYIRDNPKLHDYNVERRIDDFIETAKEWARSYHTNHVLMPMGTDFTYVQANMWYNNMDKLIKHTNARQANGSNINVLYSTPSCYTKELNNADLEWTTKQDDFFPYVDSPHIVWTGYFTSRPALKYFSRVMNRFYQSTKQMAALAGAAKNQTVQNELHHIGDVVGIAQHHDAITGTEKQNVAFDYAQRLAEGITCGKVVLQNFYDAVMPQSAGKPAPEQVLCNMLNESICDVTTQSNKFQVTLYNPMGRPAEYVTRLPVNDSSYTVYGPTGTVSSDVFPISDETKAIGHGSFQGNYELVFETSVPAVGFATYFVEKTSRDGFASRPADPSTDNEIKGKYVSVKFDSEGRMSSMSNLGSKIEVPLHQNFSYYKSRPGSGAYIFQPGDSVKINLTKWEGIHQGKLVQEARQKFGDWASQVVRVYQDKPYVEVEFTIGPIPDDNYQGKEVVTRYNIPGFGNNGVFYTDSNGREMLKRQLNYRPTWPLEQTEPVAGNYFPINAMISIKNETTDLQFTVLTDRSHGGTSLNDGDVEIMLHRRLFYDDHKGVGEALNERAWGKGLIIRGKQYLLLNKVSVAAKQYRPIAQDFLLQPTLTFSTAQLSPQEYYKNFKPNFTGLHSKLPPNVHLLTFEAVPGEPVVASPAGTVPYMLRLEHFYETGEDATLSKPVTFDLKKLLFPYGIGGLNELSLGANILAKDVQRLRWKTKDNPSGDVNRRAMLKGSQVTLNPMDIVTVQVDIFSS